jgi:predicted lipoprotein with Yx(FWY)xxD motif
MTILAGAALVVVALSVVGCGSGGGNNASAQAPPKAADGKSATVGIANESVGEVLVDSRGRTLYVFERDAGSKSACTGACSAQWPPLLASGKPTVGVGANPSLAAISARLDGTTQVTYNGHPVYLFSGDQKPGDTNGQAVNAFGGLWYVISASGAPVTTPAPGGGFGY